MSYEDIDLGQYRRQQAITYMDLGLYRVHHAIT